MKIVLKLLYTLAIIVAITGCSSDDPKVILPQLSIGDVTGAEGSQLTFKVSLNTASKDTVSFSYKTEDGTATSADYTAVTSRIWKIVPGETGTSIVITTKTDAATTEQDETFKVILSDAKNANILDGEGLGTITNVANSNPPPSASYSMKAKIDGVQWTATFSGLLPTAFQDKVLVGYGTDNSQLAFNFATTPAVKTYTIVPLLASTDTEVAVFYTPNFFSSTSPIYNGQAAGGELKITSYNTTTKIAEGTFKFTGKTTAGATKTFTEGSFKVPIE